MPIKSQITGLSPKGTRTVKVTQAGQLVVAPISYDESSFNTLDATATAYNFYVPKVGQQFIITAVLAFADKDVADNTDTIVTVYEATAPDTATESKVLFQFGMGKLTVLSLTPLNLLINEGVYINAKTGDDDIHMTIMGYYIPKL